MYVVEFGVGKIVLERKCGICKCDLKVKYECKEEDDLSVLVWDVVDKEDVLLM